MLNQITWCYMFLNVKKIEPLEHFFGTIFENQCVVNSWNFWNTEAATRGIL